MPGTRMQPVAGYPSKMAAAVALRASGLDFEQIAERINSTPGSVRASLRDAKKQALAAPSAKPDATPGIWTPEKREKVRRLYGKTLIMIAEAVAVPADELLRYVIHGVVPPSQRIRSDAEIEWQDPDQLQLPAPETVSKDTQRRSGTARKAPSSSAPSDGIAGLKQGAQPVADPLPLDDLVPYGQSPVQEALDDVKELEAAVEQLAIAAGADPAIVPEVVAAIGGVQAALAEREADEAELDRLAALEAAGVPAVIEEEPEPPLFRLQHKSGAWLHNDLNGTTYKLPQAWKGTAADIERVYVMLPKLKSYEVKAAR